MIDSPRTNSLQALLASKYYNTAGRTVSYESGESYLGWARSVGACQPVFAERGVPQILGIWLPKQESTLTMRVAGSTV